MRTLSFFILCVLIGCQYGHSQNMEQRFNTLIESGDYFELNRQYTTQKDSITPFLKAVIEPYLSSAFNKHEKAANEIDLLLKNYTKELGNSTLNFIAMLCEQLYYVGEYKAAATIIDNVITSLEKQNAPQELIVPMKTLYKKNKALENINKSTIIRLAKYSDKIEILTGLKSSNDGWYIPVEIKGKMEPFIFDTGAGGHLISESFAKRHNIKILADSIPVSGVGTGFTQIGVIDSLRIGNIIYCNVVVNITKGDILPKQVQDHLGYKIDAILGLDFMKAVGNVIIYPQKNIIEFPTHSTEPLYQHPNMAMMNNIPIVEGTSNSIRLILNFDTGAGIEGYITSKFYEHNKNSLKCLDFLDEKEVRLGGFAGTNQYKIHKIKNFPLYIGGREMLLNNFAIQETENQYDGGVGLMYFKHFDKVILDFENMQLIIK